MATVPDSRTASLLSLLYQYWQVRNFRALQQEAVLATLDKEDTILILPTGTCLLMYRHARRALWNTSAAMTAICSSCGVQEEESP